MIRVEAYRPEHLGRLAASGAQAHLRPLVEDAAYAEGLAACGPGYAALDEADRVLCVAGLHVPWEGRAVTHALLSGDCGRSLGAIIGHIRRYLDAAPYARIEAHVQTDREECHRFACLLGFARECTMRRFLGADDFDLYARIKDDRAAPAAPSAQADMRPRPTPAPRGEGVA